MENRNHSFDKYKKSTQDCKDCKDSTQDCKDSTQDCKDCKDCNNSVSNGQRKYKKSQNAQDHCNTSDCKN